jgi:hypothetical protein
MAEQQHAVPPEGGLAQRAVELEPTNGAYQRPTRSVPPARGSWQHIHVPHTSQPRS